MTLRKRWWWWWWQCWWWEWWRGGDGDGDDDEFEEEEEHNRDAWKQRWRSHLYCTSPSSNAVASSGKSLFKVRITNRTTLLGLYINNCSVMCPKTSFTFFFSKNSNSSWAISSFVVIFSQFTSANSNPQKRHTLWSVSRTTTGSGEVNHRRTIHHISLRIGSAFSVFSLFFFGLPRIHPFSWHDGLWNPRFRLCVCGEKLSPRGGDAGDCNPECTFGSHWSEGTWRGGAGGGGGVGRWQWRWRRESATKKKQNDWAVSQTQTTNPKLQFQPQLPVHKPLVMYVYGRG